VYRILQVERKLGSRIKNSQTTFKMEVTLQMNIMM